MWTDPEYADHFVVAGRSLPTGSVRTAYDRGPAADRGSGPTNRGSRQTDGGPAGTNHRVSDSADRRSGDAAGRQDRRTGGVRGRR